MSQTFAPAVARMRPAVLNFKSAEFVRQNLIAVIQQETQTLVNLTNNFPSSAEDLVEEILQTSGRIVLSGMGKSGHVARKLAATFASMGTPALFLHPSEALHGDLGMLLPNDFFIALSKSGTGQELAQIIQVLKIQNNRTALWCCQKGALATLVDLVVELPFEREACSMNLAPSSSSTLMMAFGDAVAITVSKLIGFEQKDFARAHPAGALGKRLLSTVGSFMYSKEELPFIVEEASFKEILVTITSKKLGIAVVVDQQRKLKGIITDGDLRRACELGPSVFEKTAQDLMSSNPKTIASHCTAFAALELMEHFHITQLVVVEQEKVIGLLHIHDLIKAGL